MINLFHRRTAGRSDARSPYPVLPKGRVVYAIGDIHGRSDLLDHIHATIDAASQHSDEEITEIYLGDYVDRGPDSRGVVERLISRRDRHDIVCLRGNHEEMFEAFLHGELLVEEWQPAGGIETLMSYGVDPRALAYAPNEAWLEAALRQVPASHHDFIVRLPDSHRIGDYFFAHAGVRPGVALDLQSTDDLLWIRDAFLGDRSDYGAVVVHGHTPTQEAEFHHNRINLDTGAYITSRLTCLRIDADGPQILAP
jgi:serine/threonine protein phosphatase 1